MSREAVQYTSRHYRDRPADVSLVTWVESQAVLYFIADLSDPSGHGCKASQTTIGQRFGLGRERINQLVRVLVAAGALAKVPGSRAYIVVGVQDHDPTTCGNAWCEKEAKTIFRRARAERSRQKSAKGSLAAAAADAAYLAAWAAETG